MKTFRFRSPATLCFDVEADDEVQARLQGAMMLDRIWEEGAQVANGDPEDLLVNASVYPLSANDAGKDDQLELIDETDDDGTPTPALEEAARRGEDRARQLYGKGTEACESCHGLGWLHIDDAGGYGPEVERCQGCGDGEITEDEAVRRHRIQCGCEWPENASAKPFYGGRTRMPIATFSPAVDEDPPTGMQEGVTR